MNENVLMIINMGCCEFSGSDRVKIIGMHSRNDSGPLTLLRSESLKFSYVSNEVDDCLQTAKTTIKTIRKDSECDSENNESKELPLPDISSCSSIQSWKANSL